MPASLHKDTGPCVHTRRHARTAPRVCAHVPVHAKPPVHTDTRGSTHAALHGSAHTGAAAPSPVRAKRHECGQMCTSTCGQTHTCVLMRTSGSICACIHTRTWVCVQTRLHTREHNRTCAQVRADTCKSMCALPRTCPCTLTHPCTHPDVYAPTHASLTFRFSCIWLGKKRSRPTSFLESRDPRAP